MRILLILNLLSWFVISSSFATSTLPVKEGYRIEVELEHFEGDTVLLGYYFGKSQYLKDTAIVAKGKLVFQGDDELKPGLYLLVIPPENKFIHILIDKDQSHFSVVADIENVIA